MVGIEVVGLMKAFGKGDHLHMVLKDVSLSIRKGEIVAIRGDNGCGKTTLLNILAGIEMPSAGAVSFQGAPESPTRVGYAQQDYTSSLLPWLTAEGNISIPLRLRGLPVADRKRETQVLLERLGFDHSFPCDAYPHQLSGGQKQRIAVARSFIHKPHLVLLDEPFANLDAHTSRDLQETISKVHQDAGITIIYVSHDLDQCIYLADRVLLVHGSPAKILHDFTVPLERPRRREIVLTRAYGEVRSAILTVEEALYAGSR